MSIRMCLCVCICVCTTAWRILLTKTGRSHALRNDAGKKIRKSARCKIYVCTVIAKLNFENWCLNLEYFSLWYFSAENSAGAVRTGKTIDFRKDQLTAEFTCVQLVYSYLLKIFFCV